MTYIQKLNWFYGLSALFITLNIVFVVKEMFWLTPIIPAALLISLLYLFSLDKLLLLVAFLTPLSVNVENIGFGVGMNLPTEPILFGVLLLFVIKQLHKNELDQRLLRHPLTTLIFINLAWLSITSITSSMPIVSMKFMISRFWYVTAFYLLGVYLFKDIKNIRSFIWLSNIALAGVIIYTTIRHAQYGFASHEIAHWVMTPFYNDHTAYGAALGLMLPVMIGMVLNRNQSRNARYLAGFFCVLLVGAIILCYSRATWISLSAALGVMFLYLFKVKLRLLFFTLLCGVYAFFIYQPEISMIMEKNRQDSSADFGEHVQSMYNITSDASNLERINRWNSALRMFAERPIFGWGPGTYQFKYAPFQKSGERTIISTNVGDAGNAHSEYIGPLAESGVFGSLSFILLLVFVIIRASKVYRESKDREVRILTLSILLGLITYFIHGVLNNFLDTDKASVPFWAFIGMVTALDMYHRKKSQITKADN